MTSTLIAHGEAQPIRVWTYWLPSINGEGYAWIILDSRGRFSTISDWGNYGYWWSCTGEPDFRDFVRNGLCKYTDSLVGKFGQGSNDTLYVTETVESLSKAVREHYADKPETQAEQLEEVAGIGDDYSLHEFLISCEIPDVWEHVRRGPSPQLLAFAKHTLPRLKEILDAQRTAELSEEATK